MPTPYEYSYHPGQIVGDTGCIYRGQFTPSKALFMCPFCGTEFVTKFASVLTGRTKSCGCYGAAARKASSTKHGLSGTKIYNTWNNMKDRCYNINSDVYEHYGGRGIAVCDEWRNDVLAFFNHVSSLDNYGNPGYTLDRIKVNGNYTPGNVRWGTGHMQATNQRRRRDNSSGYTGVYKKGNRWVSKIFIEGDEIIIGNFDSCEKAAHARNEFIIDHCLTEYKIQEVNHG